MEHACSNCPRNCTLNTFCQKNPNENLININIHQLHFGEEPPISGSNGSGTIFFSNCNMSCMFCQNFQISQNGAGTSYTLNAFKDLCLELHSKGAHNINLVTPTPYADRIIPVLAELKASGFSLPIVWNCGGYESLSLVQALSGLVDIYMPDFKYSDDALALELSSASNYSKNAILVLKEMREQVEDRFSEDGIMQSGLLIRHLILPSYVNNSIAVLQQIDENIGNNTYISLMSQYYPMHKAEGHANMGRGITAKEYGEVLEVFEKLGFHNGFVQDLSSSSGEYIPNFKKDLDF